MYGIRRTADGYRTSVNGSQKLAIRRTAVPCASLHLPARLQRAAERDLVGELEVAAHRQSARDARDLDAERLDQPREVQRRGLALDVGVGGDDDLGDLAVSEPVDELAARSRSGPIPSIGEIAPCSTW